MTPDFHQARLFGLVQPENRLKLEAELRNTLVPDYQWIFQQIGKLENGVKFLVDLRSDLLVCIQFN